MDDNMLLEQLADDLDGAFEALVRAHQDHLYSIALRFLGDPSDAEEVGQDALVRAYRALAGYERARIRELRLRGWLATIVIRRCRTRSARRRLATVPIDPPVGETAPELSAPSADTPLERVIRRESTERLAGYLAALPERYRWPIVLRHVDGLSYPEASEALGRPEGTVKAQVHRGLALLRDALAATEREESIA
jgi:RNA polymerase sigma-70 factor (ECF subfamily)